MINAYASESHYARILKPVWDALDERMKGTFVVHPRIDGIFGLKASRLPDQSGILMIGSHKDSQLAKGPFIYVEHGAGQSYSSRWEYSNKTRTNMLAALVPGPYCAAATEKANPGVPVLMIGAPHLKGIERSDKKAIVFAWHWRCSIAMETITAFDEYRWALPEIAKKYAVRGHGHPRLINEIAPIYQDMGIEIIHDPRQALEKAGLLVADNTSLAYEAAALDIPVVLVNSSRWRKDKNWGLRFWDVLPGPQVDHPQDLLPTIEQQINGGHQEWATERLRVTNLVYGTNPLNSLDRAVKALEKVVYAYSR